MPSNTNYWTAGTNLQNNSTYVWMTTGTTMSRDKSMWAPSQPDNYKGGENCVMLWYESDNMPNDSNCGSTFSFICEKKC